MFWVFLFILVIIAALIIAVNAKPKIKSTRSKDEEYLNNSSLSNYPSKENNPDWYKKQDIPMGSSRRKEIKLDNSWLPQSNSRPDDWTPTSKKPSKGYYDYTDQNKESKKIVSTQSTKPNLNELLKQGSKVHIVTSTLSQKGFIVWFKKYQFDIVGESNYQSALLSIAGYKEEVSKRFDCIAVLIQEPNNSHDPNAVRVEINKKKVGYLSREDAKKYKKKIFELGYGVRDTFAVRARIIGGWKKFIRELGETSEGKFGVKLDLPEFSRFKYCISTESFEDADELVKSNPLSKEQKEFFRVLELKVPSDVTYLNFTKYKNKTLKDFQKSNRELYQRWQDHIAVPEHVYSEKDIYELWNDPDVRDTYGIKKPSKAELDQAIQSLLRKGIEYENILEDEEVFFDELMKINPRLEK